MKLDLAPLPEFLCGAAPGGGRYRTFQDWLDGVHGGELPDDHWLAGMFASYGVPADREVLVDWLRAGTEPPNDSTPLRRLSCELDAADAAAGDAKPEEPPEVLSDDEIDALVESEMAARP